MHNLGKKFIVSLVALFILISGISTVSAITIQNEKPVEIEDETPVTTETVTLLKFGVDGMVEPVKIKIQLKEGEKLNDLVEEKCEELLLNDPEFKGIFDKNSTTNITSIVKSRGRGFHLKLTPSIKWPMRIDIFPLLPPYIFRSIKIPIIFCKYPRDSRAFTTVTPLLTGEANTTEGPHSVTCVGFYGFKWWLGHVSFSGFLLRQGFVGFSLGTTVKKL